MAIYGAASSPWSLCPGETPTQVSRGVPPNPWMPPGRGAAAHPTPTPAWHRGFTSTGGRKWVTAASRWESPTPGTFETQIGHGWYLKMPLSSCRVAGAPEGCEDVGWGSPQPAACPGPPQQPRAAQSPQLWVSGGAPCTQIPAVPVSCDNPWAPRPPRVPRAFLRSPLSRLSGQPGQCHTQLHP